jgi:hypothetical protein
LEKYSNRKMKSDPQTKDSNRKPQRVLGRFWDVEVGVHATDSSKRPGALALGSTAVWTSRVATLSEQG